MGDEPTEPRSEERPVEAAPAESRPTPPTPLERGTEVAVRALLRRR